MSLLFYDAVTKYTGTGNITQVWDSLGQAAITLSTRHPYGAGRSFSNNQVDTTGKSLVVALGSTVTKVRFGMWRLQHTGNFGLNNFGFGKAGNNYQAQIRGGTSGEYWFARGLYTTSYTSLGGFTARKTIGSWYWLEGYIGIGNSTGFGHLRVNGRDGGSITGVDTQVLSTDTINTFYYMHGNGNQTEWMTGLMIWSCTGDWPADEWIGPQRLDVLLPDGDGTHGDWTLSAGSSGWSLIDSETLSTSDYISSTSTGNESSFDVEALPSAAGSAINAVSAEFWGASVGGGSTEIAPGLIDASTQEYKTAQVAAPHRTYGFFPTRPGSTTAWSSTDIGNLEITVRHG